MKGKNEIRGRLEWDVSCLENSHRQLIIRNIMTLCFPPICYIHMSYFSTGLTLIYTIYLHTF